MNRAKVVAAINSWRKRSFSYGDSDCCRFVAHVLTHITGRDYIARFDYSNADGAAALIANHGSLSALVTDALGIKSSAGYSDGDPVMVRLPVVGDAMGILLGNCAVCLTHKGLTRVPRHHIREGWSICHQ
jgi:hypothetical protein